MQAMQTIFLAVLLATNNFSIASARRKCPRESGKNVPNGSITVVSNTGWVIGGWGFASPYNNPNYGGATNNYGSGNVGFGNFGDNNQGNGNYGSNNIGDGNFGNYNVGLENCGNYNTGQGNVGEWNVGLGNSGTYNLGQGNLGKGNTGNSNNGNIHVGALNSGGNNNMGIQNTGTSNIGINNAGSENVGWSNTGSWNIGSTNAGNGNVGVQNSGNWNIGYLNTGSNNTGAWNYGQGNVGYLAGVQSSTFTGVTSNSIYWKSVTIQQLDTQNQAGNCTGWANLNSTNIGIGQSGSRNLGYENVGLSNIGYLLNGTQNTGYNLTGEGLIGFDQITPDGSDFEPVYITGVEFESLLNSSVTGFMQDLVISQYPGKLSQALIQASVAKSQVQGFNPSTCATFNPIQIANTFSISVRCRGSVKITDLYCSGDSYNIYKDGRLWISTPVVPVGNDPACLNPQSDPEEAYYNPEFSHTIGWLPSGSYKLTVVPTVTRWGGGAVAIKVDDFCDRTALGKYIRF